MNFPSRNSGNISKRVLNCPDGVAPRGTTKWLAYYLEDHPVDARNVFFLSYRSAWTWPLRAFPLPRVPTCPHLVCRPARSFQFVWGLEDFFRVASSVAFPNSFTMCSGFTRALSTVSPQCRCGPVTRPVA